MTEVFYRATGTYLGTLWSVEEDIVVVEADFSYLVEYKKNEVDITVK